MTDLSRRTFLQLLAIAAATPKIASGGEVESISLPISAPLPIPESRHTIKVGPTSYKIAGKLNHPLLEDLDSPEITIDIMFISDGVVEDGWLDAFDTPQRFELQLKDGTVTFDAYCEACEYLEYYNEHWLVSARLLIKDGSVISVRH